jgi:hypothetical protein
MPALRTPRFKKTNAGQTRTVASSSLPENKQIEKRRQQHGQPPFFIVDDYSACRRRAVGQEFSMDDDEP